MAASGRFHPFSEPATNHMQTMESQAERSFLSTLRPANLWRLLRQTFDEWLEDKAPQLGAALSYYTVFSLAPLVLVLLAIIGFIFRNDPGGAWNRVTEQMSYVMDPSGVK